MTEEQATYAATPASELTIEQLREINGQPWDGELRIESPLHAGDYVMVSDTPRLSMEEWDFLWDYPLNSQTTIEDRKRLGDILGRVFTGWQLTGMDGKPIPGPENPLAWRALARRDFIWLFNRLLRVLQRLPLA